LKQKKEQRPWQLSPVAPPAGAWIETLIACLACYSEKRRAPRGRVD